MANIIFTKALEQIQKTNLDWETDTLCLLLVRSTSAYSPSKDHDYLDSFTGGGGVEISVASYARRTLIGGNINLNDPSNQVEFQCNNVAFGSLESGQTVKALLVYLQVGGDDLSPEDDLMIAYIDTDANGSLPVALGGGAFNITINGEGLMKMAQA
jgi:hypothetical protein